MIYCNVLLKKLRSLKFNEKRTFRIETIPMDDSDVEDYIKKIASKYRKQQEVYSKKGKINYRFNILGNDEDIWILTRSNTVVFR